MNSMRARMYPQIYRYLAIFLLCSIALASMPLWVWEKSLELEKEQVYKADISVGNVQKILEFRWTLFKNKGLVLHIRYDKFNHQVVLYEDYQRNAYKIPLGRGNSEQKDEPHLVIYFKNFSDKKAHLKLYIEGIGASVISESVGKV